MSDLALLYGMLALATCEYSQDEFDGERAFLGRILTCTLMLLLID